MRSVKVQWVVGFKQKQWVSKEIFQNIIHIQASNRTMYALCEITLSCGIQAGAMALRRRFFKHYKHANIQLIKVCALWKYTEWCASNTSNGFQNFFKTLYTFKHTNEQSMRSVKVHWAVGFRQKQSFLKKFFKTLYTFQYTIKQCMRSVKVHWVVGFKQKNGFQKNFFHTLYTLKHQIEQNMRSVKVKWVLGFKQQQWLSEEFFWNIIHIQTYIWTNYAFCESTLSGGIQAEAMGFRRSFSTHYTHSNLQLNNVCALWKFNECWDASRSNGSQKEFFETIYTCKHTVEQNMRSVKVHWVVGFKQKQWVSEEVFKHYIHSNIQLNNVCALWKYTEWWASSRSNGFQKRFFETLYTFKHAIEQSMRSVKVHWAVGFKQKQWLPEWVFRNIIHIQTYNWRKYAICESTRSGGFQAEAMGFRRSFSKHYTRSNIQSNKVCALWKYTESWDASRSNDSQKNFFETLYTFKHTIKQFMRAVKVQWVVGFKHKQRLSEKKFRNDIHIQTCNWTKQALCESTLSGGIQAEAMGFRRSFSTHYTHSNIQLNNVCALWKFNECWDASRSNGSQKKFFETLYTFKHTIKQVMCSVKVQWVVGFKQKQWVSEEVFQNIIHIQAYKWTMYVLCKSKLSGGLQAEAMARRRSFPKQYTHANIQLNKVCAPWKYTEWWASSRSNGFQKKFFKTLYTCKHTFEQIMHSVKVHWLVGFKQKQKLSEEFFWNIIHIQTYDWTNYALCESTLTGGIQAEAMGFRRSFSTHYTHSHIQLNNVCALWKFNECWDASRSNGSQKKFFEKLYTFKHTIKQIMRSVKLQWVVGFKQKQWFSEEVFQNIINIQAYNWTIYVVCKIKLSGGLHAEAMARRRNFLKQYTHANIQLNKVCAPWKYTEWWASSRSNSFQKKFFKILYTFKHTIEQSMRSVSLWKYTEWWASSRSNGFQKKFFKTLYTLKHTIEQFMHSVKVHWLVGFKQKQWVSEEVFPHITHIHTYNWTMYALCESSMSVGMQAEAMARRRSFFETLYTFKHTIKQFMRSVKVQWVVGFKQKQWVSEVVFQNIIHIHTYNWTKYAFCESTLSSGLQAAATAIRGSFLKHYTHSNIQLNKKCALWKYTEWWASSRSNGFQKKFFKTLYKFKHTIEQCMRSVKTLSGGHQAEAMGFRRSFSKHYTHSNIQLNKVCILWKYTEWWVWSRSNGFQKKFFKTLYTFKHTIEQSIRSVKVHWVMGLKQKQWLSEELLPHIMHIQTYNWTMYALCESSLSGEIQTEAMPRRRSFLKHDTHSNIQLKKVCALWKYSEWWASSRSNGFQKKFFKTLYTFKHTIEQRMRSVKVHWVVGFKQKQWVSEEVLQNIIHIQTYNWTMYALCESSLSGEIQTEAMPRRRSFLKHYTHSNIQLNKVCALWTYSEWWASSRSNGFQENFSKKIYTFKC